MPLNHQSRIAIERQHPRIVDLWFALQPLKSVISFMQSGAHPDDETSAMLAALAYRDGFTISYACANRGEGGQNALGTETTEDLGTLRTAEMERAADVLGLRLYWLSESPEDTIFDFGFSKSGVETLKKWGRDRTLKRFVEIVRTEQPDILCPTFLDVPGQHGHHRAMTEMAHLAMEAAADPGFPGVSQDPWQVKKLYLPAWSGAGQSYDDDVPPPPATLSVDATGVDPVTGWSWERIGQQSRACHRTQGMGRWIPAGEERSFPLHLAVTHVPGPDAALADGLAATLEDMADGAGAAGILLRAADAATRDTVAAFPAFPDVLNAATEALKWIRSALSDDAVTGRPGLRYRLEMKESQLARVIRLATGVEIFGSFDRDWITPGEPAAFTVERRAGQTDDLQIALELPDGWTAEGETMAAGSRVIPSHPYPSVHLPSHPRAPAMKVSVTAGGVTSETRLALTVPPVLLPERTVTLSPIHALLNTATGNRTLDIAVGHVTPAGAVCCMTPPEGWQAEPSENGFRVTAPKTLEDGLFALPLTLDGQPAKSVRRIDYPHIAPRARAFPASLTVRAVHAALPDVKVGYVGGGNDRVGLWLSRLGADVTDLSDADLQDADRLAAFDTIVLGIFSLRTRPALRPVMPRLHAWIAAGGTLLTLYHRPWDNWDADRVPPRRLEIGQPSLRWRVTDETAEVRHLVPEHPLLTTPNVIGPQDWAGWHKERGLYFARSWDAAYTPLLEMADPGETPHQGALLSAEIGAGRHTHTSLILHHQMEKLTAGAFRLTANLIAKRR